MALIEFQGAGASEFFFLVVRSNEAHHPDKKFVGMGREILLLKFWGCCLIEIAMYLILVSEAFQF